MKELGMNFLEGLGFGNKKEDSMKEKGFSLAELGIAMVIMLILATIAAIAYFTFIDDANNVKSTEDASAIQTAVATHYAQDGTFGTTGTEATVSDEVYQAIGATLSTNETGDLRATASTNGLVVTDEVLVDVDKDQWVSGNITVPTSDTIDADEVKALVNVETIDFDALKQYLGASVTAEQVADYFVVTVK